MIVPCVLVFYINNFKTTKDILFQMATMRAIENIYFEVEKKIKQIYYEADEKVNKLRSETEKSVKLQMQVLVKETVLPKQVTKEDKYQDIEPAKEPKVLPKQVTKEGGNKRSPEEKLIVKNFTTARKKFETADKHWRLAYESYESEKIASYDSDNETVIALDLYGYDDEPAPNLSKKGYAAWIKSRKLLVIKIKLKMELYIEEKLYMEVIYGVLI
jgi:hypothetical protein